MEFRFSPILALMPTSPGFGDAVGYLLAGFGIVMLTLLALAIVCAAIGALFKAFPGLATAGAAVVPEKPAPSRVESGVDEEVVAVIGAAVDQALGGRYQIKSVKPLDRKQ